MRYPTIENLRKRDLMITAMREWFHREEYFEVETPIRIAAPAPEPHIDCPRSGDAWLRASPELQMKRLLAAGIDRIFQFGACFRAGERGRRHNPEFTMLEWYRKGATYEDILRETEALIRWTVKNVLGDETLVFCGNRIDFAGEWESKSVRKAYIDWAGWDIAEHFDQDRFDEDMALKIEPSIPKDRPFVLRDYPAEAASLARLRADDQRFAERWELYIGGIEIANAYGELADGKEQRKRFEEAKEERRELDEDDYPLDEEFLSELESGAFPACGGIAVGVDRLAMVLCNAKEIGEVRAFCES